MKRTAIDKAADRLVKAKKALAALKTAGLFEDFDHAWSDLLIALNTVQSVLENGARQDARSRRWFGAKKAVIRKDPLLRYVHQARNADEHGIENITERLPGSVAIGSTSGNVIIRGLSIDEHGRMSLGEVQDPTGGKPYIVAQPPCVRLKPVRDGRFGTTFDPPTEHLGKLLPNTAPIAVGEAALSFHEQLVEEARTLTAPPAQQ